jgi:UDP-2,4-diacetamido-2,4,6-trideoxy-beta-L-altropyranose hydrolase
MPILPWWEKLMCSGANNKIRMLFRVDANRRVGRGHLSRMLAICHMLKFKFAVAFIVSANDREYCSSLLRSSEVYYLQKEEDIFQILTKQDVLWVDGYNFDCEWRLKVKPSVLKLVFISDFPGEVQGADMVINHCPGMGDFEYVRYPGTIYLLGLRYVMLRPAFLRFAREKRNNHVTGEGVFICFGGADPLGLGEEFVDLLKISGFLDPIYYVSTGRKFAVSNPPNVQTLQGADEEEMAYYMRKAKVVVVSASILALEAIALQKRIFCFYYVDNQKFMYDGLTRSCAAIGGGKIERPSDISRFIPKFFDMYNRRESGLNKPDAKMIDGYSGQRLVQVIYELINHVE